MVEWVKVGTNVVVGGAAGAIDQVLQNQDQKREEEKGEKLAIMSQYGTYYNYGVPILAIIGAAFGFLKGDWATRLITAGSTLAGRKATWHITKRERVVAYTKWTRDRALEAPRRAEAQRLAATRAQAGGARPPPGAARPQVGGPISPVGIPIIANETVLV